MQSGLRVLEFNLSLVVLSVKVKYRGTKSYNEGFKDDGIKEAIKSTTYSVKNLVPGSQYDFEVYRSSICSKSSSVSLKVETTMQGEHSPMTFI